MKKICLFIFTTFVSLAVFGLERIVRGQVTVHEEIPLIGAAITVKSSGDTFYTDSHGNFRLNCKEKDFLLFSAKGFAEEKTRINKKTKYVLINLKLKSGDTNRELALGYVSMNDKDRLYAVKSLEEDELDYSKYQNIYQALTGNFPGLQIQNGEVIIRNSATFNASNSALLIVDGREVTSTFFANIATAEIKNITVMKDASAAIYGSRGGNGVVVVETKRGKKK